MRERASHFRPAARTALSRAAGHQPLRRDRHTGAIGTRDGDGELPAPLAGAIDDRIAEILDELLDERNAMRPHRRLRHAIATLVLVLVLAAGVLLRLAP